jgi:hypothetical protein
MAQPIFEDHPLRDYLRRSFFTLAHTVSHHHLTFTRLTESGDVFDPIPGAMSDLPDPFSEDPAEHPSDADLRMRSWLPAPILRLAEVSLSLYLSYRRCCSVGTSVLYRYAGERDLY